MSTPGHHVVLLGDSIFDNGAYTGGHPDVESHLRRVLPPHWRVTRLAMDGASTRTVWPQLSDIPADATHLVLSLGGNDALMNFDLLSTPLRSSADALLLFDSRLVPFEEGYRRVLQALASGARELTVCTIYNCAFTGEQSRLVVTAIAMFNDVIARAALAHAARMIELRAVCTEPGDYANAIEPSGEGGRKVALAIASAVGAIPGTTGLQVSGASL